MTRADIYDRGIYASVERWREIRAQPAFLELVRLARVVNSLTLAYPPLLSSVEDQSPRARRERFAALFYAAALIHEGLHTAQSLGKHFRDLSQYQNGFAAIFADPSVQKFRTDILSRLRNELVFHFDRDALAAGLERFPDGEALLVTAPDFTVGETYFDVADDALLAYLFGDGLTEESYLRQIGDFAEQVPRLFNRFMYAAHSLIPAALRQMGCYGKPARRPQPPLEESHE